MPNFNSFGNINQPMATADIAENSSRNGVLYYSTTNIQNVGANGFIAFQLSNPTTANRAARIVRVFSGGEVNTTQFYLNGTITGGVTLSGFNGNFGFGDTSQMIPSFSVSTVNPVTSAVTLTTVLQMNATPVNDLDGRFIVPPGGRFIVLLQKNVGGTNSLSISVSWIEQ